jgi:hypothetical protein
MPSHLCIFALKICGDGRELAVSRAVTVPHREPKRSARPGHEGTWFVSAEALQKSKHNLPIVSRILSSAKDFYFWQSPHNEGTVNADSER